MKDDILSRALEVASPAAAAAFADPLRRHLILSFVGRERSIAEVARTGRLSVSLAHYHVRRLCALGILKVSSIERRPGRPIRKYTARAAAFFVPDALQRRAFNSALDRELNLALESRRDAGHGWLAYVDRRGTMRMRRETLPNSINAPASLDEWKILDLDSKLAAQLAADLQDVLRRYEHRQARAGARRYLVRCAIVQRAGDRLFATGAARGA